MVEQHTQLTVTDDFMSDELTLGFIQSRFEEFHSFIKPIKKKYATLDKTTKNLH